MRTLTEPDEVAVPAPLTTVTEPPVAPVLLPALAIKVPPVALPDPTDTATLPPEPPTAEPDKIETLPEDPDASPVEKLMAPLTPAVPALADANAEVPLDTPAPDTKTMLPPDEAPDVPAVNPIDPPTELEELPT